MQHAQNGSALTTSDYAVISQHFRKLELQPDFSTQYDYIASLYESPTPSDDPYIISTQYFAQVVWNTYWLYDIPVPDSANAIYASIDLVNTTWTTDLDVRYERRNESLGMLGEFLSEPLNDAFTGILWLVPVAGIVLILCTIRSMLWYRFHGSAHWIIHISQLVGGVSLALLGLLDLGPKDIVLVTQHPAHIDLEHVNPLYRVVGDDIPLTVVAAVYLATYLGSAAILRFQQRRKARRSMPTRDLL